MKKFSLIVISLVLIFAGCSTKQPIPPKPKIYKQHTGKRASDRLLGDLLGCSGKMVDFGYTKEACGDSWGIPLEIDWGNDKATIRKAK